MCVVGAAGGSEGCGCPCSGCAPLLSLSHPSLKSRLAWGLQIVQPFTSPGSPLTLGLSSQGPGLAAVTYSRHRARAVCTELVLGETGGRGIRDPPSPFQSGRPGPPVPGGGESPDLSQALSRLAVTPVLMVPLPKGPFLLFGVRESWGLQGRARGRVGGRPRRRGSANGKGGRAGCGAGERAVLRARGGREGAGRRGPEPEGRAPR